MKEQNDQLRCYGIGGTRELSDGIDAQDNTFVDRVIEAVVTFDDFNREDDPTGDHVCGRFTIDEQEILWRIDDHRTLHIMLSGEVK